MAVYDKRRFYWYKLTYDFFNQDDIKWLEEQPNGDRCAYFYLKLCAKSILTNGVLIRDIGNFQVAYTNELLAKATNTDIDIVEQSMRLFEEMGIIKLVNSGAIFITNLEDMIGEKSVGAFKKEVQKRLRGGKMVENFPPDIDID